MKAFVQIVALFLWFAASGFAQEREPVDFAREILPILSNKCFVCHGPDAKDEDLVRLDSFSGATAELGDYQAIDPKHPEKSELLTRIDSVDDPMPPVDFDKKLTDQERALLRRWVEAGGKYSKHWAFVPPVKAKGVKLAANRNPIDYWVGSQLEA
ncbi:MAG: c-type cytochrome domain-containing protein, partial [Mariniblastus sp.]